MKQREITITALAAGGDGVGRDDGRVTFVPRTAPGDRVRVELVQETKSFARGRLLEVLAPGPGRVTPTCPVADRCGGCTWQHVSRAEQLAAKAALVEGALRKLAVQLHPIADPAPPLGWRRRARFHVAGGKIGLYELGSTRIVPLAEVQHDAATGATTGSLRHCPQLEPALDAVLGVLGILSLPDGDVALLLAGDGAVTVALERAWKPAAKLVGRAGIVGVVAGDASYGEPLREVEPGLWLGPRDFAQASAAGNRALGEVARTALGPRGDRRSLLELHAGAGNFTRLFVADGWDVTASDAVQPARPITGDTARFIAGAAADVAREAAGPFDAVVLDPPRTGAADAMPAIAQLAAPTVVYISCDPATLARDAAVLTAAGYRATDAWPLDVMPQTAHVEVVLRLVR